jgi:hypothetical protein
VRDAKTVSIDAQNGPTSFSTEYLQSVFVWCKLSYCYFPLCTHNVTSFAINSLCIHSLSKHTIANSSILLYRGWNALAWVSMYNHLAFGKQHWVLYQQLQHLGLSHCTWLIWKNEDTSYFFFLHLCQQSLHHTERWKCIYYHILSEYCVHINSISLWVWTP